MAHFDFITRGNYQDVEKLTENIRSMYFPRTIKKGNKKRQMIYSVALRPIQLWEAVACKEDLPTVIKSISADEKNPKQFYSWQQKYLTGLRIAMRLKKLPKLDPETPKRILWNQNIEVLPIGVKDDKYDEDGNELL